MDSSSGTWIPGSFYFGELDNDSTKAMCSCPSTPTSAPSDSARQGKKSQDHTLDDATSDSDCPLMTRYAARAKEKSVGSKRSRQEMEEDSQTVPIQPDHEDAMQRERLTFSVPASKRAREMSAKSDGVFGPLLCEMILELFRQKAWSLELIQDHAVSVENKQSKTSSINIPLRISPPSSAKSFEMTPEERIQEIVDDTRFRKTKVIGLYGQGRLDIGGQKASFSITDGSKRCDACVKFKRGSSVAIPAYPLHDDWNTNFHCVTDCFRVEPDEFYKTTACATCCEKGHRCSFLVGGSMNNK